MKTQSYITIVLLLLIISVSAQAQDKIFKKNKEVILCKIIKVDVKYIQYAQPEYHKDVTFNIAKSKVSKIEFANGDLMDFEKVQSSNNTGDNKSAAVSIENNKKNALKIDFFSPLTGNLTLIYERSLVPQKSVVMSLGIIGVGANTFINEAFNGSGQGRDNSKGVFGKLGYKFMRSPEVYSNAGNVPHLLKGSYIQPEIIYSAFSSDEQVYISNPIPGQDTYEIQRINHSAFSFMINFGKQWVIQDAFLLDWHLGVGYGFGDNGLSGYYFSHLQGGDYFPIAATLGFSFGFLL